MRPGLKPMQVLILTLILLVVVVLIETFAGSGKEKLIFPIATAVTAALAWLFVGRRKEYASLHGDNLPARRKGISRVWVGLALIVLAIGWTMLVIAGVRVGLVISDKNAILLWLIPSFCLLIAAMIYLIRGFGAQNRES